MHLPARRLTLALLLALLVPTSLHADDGAASIAAGGLILMHREPRITMAKEVLRISRNKVVVDYDFRNDSPDTVSTGIAFPIPAYDYSGSQQAYGDAHFDDFKLNIDGKPFKFITEARAFLGDKDVTDQLLAEHIDPATFGHAPPMAPSKDFMRLPATTRARLIKAGLFAESDAADEHFPLWEVRKKYFWTQVFPPHATVHIQHSYTPVVGGSSMIAPGLPGPGAPKPTHDYEQYAIDEVNSLCLDDKLKQTLLAEKDRRDLSIPYFYVDFILTTANTWKTPIEDFTLIVERPAPDKLESTKPAAVPNPNRTYVSFCSTEPVTRLDANHFSTHITNFVPTKELRIGFISVDRADPF